MCKAWYWTPGSCSLISTWVPENITYAKGHVVGLRSEIKAKVDRTLTYSWIPPGPHEMCSWPADATDRRIRNLSHRRREDKRAQAEANKETRRARIEEDEHVR